MNRPDLLPLSEQDASSPADRVNSNPDPGVEALRDILFSRYRRQMAELEAELDGLENRLTDRDALIAAISPVLGQAIRRQIRDSREEMIDTLYPLIGQLVVRAVAEAIRDLTRTIDAQMRTSFNPAQVGQRLKARITGVSDAEMLLRQSLPFEVTDVLLIHRENGLLLWHISRDPENTADSDIISGMLTAIQDFVQDAFGQDDEVGGLDQIQYGSRRILIERGQLAYLAVVVEGTEPPGFQAEMRERVADINLMHEKTLRHYKGDPTPLAPVEPPLKSLLYGTPPKTLSATQRWVLAGAAGFLLACVVGTCFLANWGIQVSRKLAVTPSVVIVQVTTVPTATPIPSATPTATASPTPTATNTPIPTATPTATTAALPTPTATPVLGIMTGNVWLHDSPLAQSSRLGMALETGQPVQVLAVTGDWYQISWSPKEEAMVIGWVPAKWVGILGAIPAELVTPEP